MTAATTTAQRRGPLTLEPTHEPDPEAEYAHDAHERYEERRARITADKNIHPVLRDLLLDRTLINSAQQAEVWGVGEPRVSRVRQRGEALHRMHPKGDHPAAYPRKYAGSGRVGQIERGHLIDHLIAEGMLRFDYQTLKLVRAPHRTGRPRRRAPGTTRNIRRT